MRKFCLVWPLFLALNVLCFSEAKIYPYRWVYIADNLKDNMQVKDVERKIKTAAAGGLNGVVFSGGLDRLSGKDVDYFDRLRTIKNTCEEFKTEIIPVIFSVGNSSDLGRNKNLAEGLPVKDSLFTVKENIAVLTPDFPVKIENGGFEDYKDNTLSGYNFCDQPGEVSIVDTKVFYRGKASLRFQMFRTNPYGNGRITQEVKVKQNRLYRLSLMLKTDKLEPADSFKLQVFTLKGKALAPVELKIKSTQDWKKTVIGFNSGENEIVKVCAGVWGGKYGRFWLDDWELEELGPVNILRRPGTPLTVKGEAAGIIYEEGKDFEPVFDPLLNFRFEHEAPLLRIPAGSRIQNGEKLRVSYYHGIAITDGRVVSCMSEPELYETWKSEFELLHKTLGANKYVLGMEEIRMGGTCGRCKDRKISMAEILGDSITKACAIIKGINPNAEIFVWSDMFDPNHNAHDNYFLVDGDFSGSWNYIPRDLGIICWYYKGREACLKHFDTLGFKILAGAYNDSISLDSTKEWLKSLDKTKGAAGVIYVTRENRYEFLTGFGRLVSGKKEQNN